VVVGERYGVGVTGWQVGVAGDAEAVLMVHAVMPGAKADQVPGFGGSVVFVVDDLVHLHPAGLRAARYPAATVAVLHQTPGAVGHDVLAVPDPHRVGVLPEHCAEGAVTRDVAADAVRHQPAVTERAVASTSTNRFTRKIPSRGVV